MEIRRNDPTALARFAELNIAWIEELHFAESTDLEMVEHPEKYIEDNNSVFSIHIDGEVAGVCALKQDGDGEFELTKMAVHHDYQRRGLGKVLMDNVETHAKNELGLERIYLLSNTKNEAAIRLYKRCGWTVIFEGKPHPKYARANIGMEKYL